MDSSNHNGRPLQRVDPIAQIHTGGIGQPRDFQPLARGPESYEKQYFPGQRRSLSGIASRAFVLGFVFSTCLIFTTLILALTTSSLWLIPVFLAALSLFHFLEFWTTARYNTPEARVSSYLLSSNGSAYNLAHTAAILECLFTNIFFPDRRWLPSSLTTGLVFVGMVMMVVGQVVRSAAMVQAGTNFNHVVQHRRTNEHHLVTTGLYYYLRHPSYFGFFYWGLGTQLVLSNMICFTAYAFVLWSFFSSRISGEEELLIAFFDDDYIRYRRSTNVWIPFIR